MKNIFLTVFISKLKNALFGGSTYFFSKFFSPVLAFKTIYKCYYYQYSLKCKFGFGLLKSYLTLGQLTCSDRSKKMSTLHPTVQYTVYCYVHTLNPLFPRVSRKESLHLVQKWRQWSSGLLGPWLEGHCTSCSSNKGNTF